MNLSTIRARARRYSRTTESSYSNTDLDADINLKLYEVWMVIFEAQGYKNLGGDFKVYDLISTVGLVSGEIGFNGEYGFPTQALSLDSVELNYGNGHVKAEIIDRSNQSSSLFTESEYNAEFSQTNPKVFVYRDSYFVRPTNTSTTVEDGIKLTISARPTILTNTTDSPTFDLMYHDLIPLKVAQDYALFYPEKANPRIDRKVEELEAMLISDMQSRVPIQKRFRAKKEYFGSIRSKI